ncbi:MAG TPA: hypothetical protein VLC12_09710 [Terriglobales bacterium]|nr:hypothetical protein [Terriglobales bacterium]
MTLATALLLLFTLAMVVVHLISGRLLRRAWGEEPSSWLSVLNIFRFEGFYYLALLGYVYWARGRFLLAPLLVMAALHLAGWAVAERRPGWLVNAGEEAARARVLAGVQLFDLAETVVLLYIAWVLTRAMFSAA